MRVFQASAVRQVNQFYRSRPALFCFVDCFPDEYKCGIELSIGEFSPVGKTWFDLLLTDTVAPGSSSSYMLQLASMIDSSIAYVEGLANVSRTANTVITIVSDSFDAQHDGDIPAMLSELSTLQSAVLAALPGSEATPAFFRAPGTVPPTVATAAAAGAAVSNPLLDAATDVESGEIDAGTEQAAAHQRLLHFVENTEGVQIVSDDGSIFRIPSQWLSLLPVSVDSVTLSP
jgi:hypothetical protein